MSKKLLIISDTHFSKNNSLLFTKVDAEKHINLLRQDIIQEAPEYMFILGDMSQDGTTESYNKVKSFLDNFACPKYIIMGNHDSSNIQYLLSSDIIMCPFLDIDNHRFIFISSYKGINKQGINYDEGYVSKTELNKISKYFDSNKQNYLIIHHHFIKTGGIIDNWILDNHEEFCKHIQKFHLKAVFHGHVHNGYKKQLGTIDIFATPSTCIQFALTPKLNLESIIGYQKITLMDNSYEQETINKII